MKIVAGIAGLLLLIVRGFVLWFLIPFSILAWLLVHSWAQKARLGQAICWYDWNFAAFLFLVPFRPALRYSTGEEKIRFLRMSEMREMPTYRISLTQLN
ncbi:MAG: hypothetical protein K0R99_2873 [Microbacterium sp.]|jgi:hypothetical protein|uniref:hypothetical protein n=1 Tax=Microbacterium sp. TaxID=51671 RepID=UPI0026163B7F|nr:hypothetical protein [Microbacterium sp.]MDF2561427.1 hypothetical protein [Microbacterium sp.]